MLKHTKIIISKISKSKYGFKIKIWIQNKDDVEDRQTHLSLKDNLVENIWQKLKDYLVESIKCTKYKYKPYIKITKESILSINNKRYHIFYIIKNYEKNQW